MKAKSPPMAYDTRGLAETAKSKGRWARKHQHISTYINIKPIQTCFEDMLLQDTEHVPHFAVESLLK